MPNTIVMNTITAAVSEYDGFPFQSITPTQAGSAMGLYTLGGDLDDDALIVSRITTGKTQWGSAFKKIVEMVWFALKGSGTSRLTVIGEASSYDYDFPVRAAGESRCKPGMGIRENYLAFGYSNPDGADFQIDKIEVSLTNSKTRRV